MAKFVYGHTEVFLEISRRNCITDPRGYDRWRETFSSGKNYLLPGYLPKFVRSSRIKPCWTQESFVVLEFCSSFIIAFLLSIGAQFHMLFCVLHFRIFQLTPLCSFFVKKGSYAINRSLWLNCQIKNPLLCTIYRINLHQYYKINMRREIYFDMAMERTKKYVFGNQGTGFRVVATGFWSGYYHTKVNAEEKK